MGHNEEDLCLQNEWKCRLPHRQFRGNAPLLGLPSDSSKISLSRSFSVESIFPLSASLSTNCALTAYSILGVDISRLDISRSISSKLSMRESTLPLMLETQIFLIVSLICSQIVFENFSAITLRI